MLPSVRILFLSLLLGSFAAADQSVVWTTTQKRTFEASFVKLDGENAIFKQEGSGRLFATPVALIHPKDHFRLKVMSPAGTALPPARSNFGGPWPRGVRLTSDASSKVVSENRQEGIYVYESANYRFHCNAKLTLDVLRNFATMFETTHQFSKALPLSMSPARTDRGKLTILLFDSMDSYYRSGGIPGTAGVFNSRSGQVLVPMESLGLQRVGNDFRLDPKGGSNAVLIHELAHQLSPAAYYAHGARGWFSEGLAEYMSVTPYHWGYFQPDPHGNAVLSYVSAYGQDGKQGRALGKSIRVPKLRTFMLMDYGSFSANANTNYGLGLLLVHYFFHMQDGGRPMRVTQYLKNLHDGKTGEEAIAPLLGGGTFEKLEAEITEAWGRKGIQIAFLR